MPHVELRGPIDLAAVHGRFAPLTWTDSAVVTKALQCYLSADHRTLLFECHVVEGYLRQNFFVLVTSRPDGVMVRLHPRSAPEKTSAVKRCVAGLALWTGGRDATIANTNLSASFSEPLPEARIDHDPPA